MQRVEWYLSQCLLGAVVSSHQSKIILLSDNLKQWQWGSKGGAVVRALASHQSGPDSNPGVDAICGWVCWFSLLLREVFLWVLRFSPLLQNRHFQIPIRSGTHGHVSTSSYELLSDPWVNKLQFTIQIIHNQPNFAIYKTPTSTYLSMVCWRPAFFSFSVLTALRRASNDLLETTSSKVSSIMSWRNFLCRLYYSFIKVTYM